jgi:hypothetical protein
MTGSGLAGSNDSSLNYISVPGAEPIRFRIDRQTLLNNIIYCRSGLSGPEARYYFMARDNFEFKKFFHFVSQTAEKFWASLK